MKFLRLQDPLLEVLFEDDDLVAVNKPYGIDPHTNDSKTGQAELVQPGLIELFEVQLGRKLHIVHRLDRTTTGVIVFGKSLESAKKYQTYFRAREAKKTYLFVTAARLRQTELKTSTPIVHKGSSLDAATDFKLLQQGETYALWQATPHTGRNHQIRIHAAEVGIPLLGDSKYEGAPYPFLCLHNRKLEFSNGLILESAMPRYFKDLSLLEEKTFAQMLLQVDRRERLYARALHSKQCMRLSHSDAGTLEQFGEWLVFNARDGHSSGVMLKLAQKSARILDRQILLRGAGASQLEAMAPPKWFAYVGRIKLELRPDVPSSIGVYLDQRMQLEWLIGNSAGKSVLNLFAGNCTSAVAACAGEARAITALEASKTLLAWGRENFSLNELSVESHKLLCRDSMTYLEACADKGLKFDLLICHAPAFARFEKKIFKIESDLEKLLRLCLRSLNPSGTLLFSTSAEKIFVDDIRRCLLKLEMEHKTKLEISNLQASLDCGLPGEKPSLKSFLVQI